MAQDRIITLDSPDIPVIQDPYIGTAYGNMLDSYDSVTYNLKLYMISPFGTNSGGTRVINEPGNSGTTTSSNNVVAEPSQTIVIAQSGVTRNIIDNLELETLGGLHTPARVTFEIFQPNKANLLDQIILAKNRLGIQGNRLPPVYLEISFLGRTVDHSGSRDANEQEGQLVRITEPFRYELTLTNVNASLTSDGGRFQFEAVVKNTEAYSDKNFRLQESLTITGTTITEMLTDLAEKLTDQHTDSAYEVNDQFEFVLEKLIASGAAPGNEPSGTAVLAPLIQNQGLLIPGIEGGTDTKNIPSGNQIDNSDIYLGAYEYIRENVVDTVPGTNQIRLREGISIQDIVLTIMSMNREFLASLTRTSSTSPQPDPTPEDRRRAFIKWVKVNATVEYLGFDSVRNDYGRKITFTPYFYRTARTDVYANPKENSNLVSDEIAARLSTMIESQVILKSYQYLFTGLNDQIRDLDITFNNALTVLLAKDSGYSGNFQTATRDSRAGSVATGTNVGRSGQTAEASTTSQANLSSNTFDLLNRLRAGGGDLTGLIEQIAGRTDLTPDFIANVLRTGAESEVQAIAALVDPFGAGLARGGTITNTGTTEVAEGYSPNASPQVLDDFIALSPGQTLDLDQLENNNIIFLTAQQAAQELKISNSNEANYILNKAEGATTETGKNTNMVFGQLINQQETDRFLLELDMTLRGDPWYLSRDPALFRSTSSTINPTSVDNETSQPEAAYFGKDAQYFVFTVASPPPRDLDVTDEDNNTGYWLNNGVNYTFTGIYMMMGATHNFSGGDYTTQVKGTRIPELDIAGLPADWPQTLQSLNRVQPPPSP